MIQLRGGYETTDVRLDRVPHFDPRSRNYPIRALLPTDRPFRAYTWRLGSQLDQGSEGACVGFSIAMEAAARPVIVPDVTNDTAFGIYRRAKQLDPWQGEDYEGTSVLAGAQAATEAKWYKEYRWALGPGAEAAARDAILALGYHGPIVLGTWWWSGMDSPDKDGYLRPTGSKRGGHAYVSNVYSRKKKGLWVPNSWGGSGQGWIHEDDLVQLLDDEGECMIPVKRTR